MSEFIASVNWNALAAMGSLVAAFATAWAAFEAKRAAQISEKISQDSENDTQLEIFLKFSEEYDALKIQLDERYFHQGNAFENDQVISLQILKLFEKEYHLFRHGFIKPNTWQTILEPKIIRFVNNPLVKATWGLKNHYKQYDFGDSFETYVEEKMKA